MATESFGVSFGNPNRYIGSSPLGEIWKGLKTGASVYGMQKTGFIDFLDKLGVKQKDGVFSFGNDAAPAAAPAPVPEGSAAPPAAMAPAPQPVPPTPAVVPPAPVDNPLNDPAFKPQSGFVMPQTSGYTTPETQPVPTPRLQGVDILDGKISINNPNDFDPRENFGYTTQLATGSEYTQQPGYGKNKKLMSSLFGMA
jgi:hypothetical protein